MTGSRPRVLAILPIFGPSTVVSIVKPFLQLHRAGYISVKITLESLVDRRDVDKADLVIFCRNTEPRYARLLHLVVRRNTPFIYELDDNFFEIPLDSEVGEYYRAPERLALVTEYMGRADLVRVYSEPLYERARTLNSCVEKVVGPVDFDLVSPAPPSPYESVTRIVYATSRSVDELANIFTPALLRVLEAYDRRVEAHFWGYNPPQLRSLRNVSFQPVILNYDRFLRRFSRAGFDIGLAPLLDTIFYRSKTNNKFREYGASRIAGIYSNVDVYSDCVTHGETGLLVPNQPQAWYEAIIRLIEDRSLRNKIKDQAYDYVHQHYSQESFEQTWLRQIEWVLATRPSPIEARPPGAGRELPTSPEPKVKRDINSPTKWRRISKGPRKILALFSQEPEAVSSNLRQHWYTFWMLLKIHYLTSSWVSLTKRPRSPDDNMPR